MDPLGYGLPSIFFCQRTSFVPFFRCTGHSLQLLSDELGPLWWWLAPSHDGTHTPKKNLEREWSPGVVWEFSTAVFGIIHKHSHPEKRKRRDQNKNNTRNEEGRRKAFRHQFFMIYGWKVCRPCQVCRGLSDLGKLGNKRRLPRKSCDVCTWNRHA